MLLVLIGFITLRDRQMGSDPCSLQRRKADSITMNRGHATNLHERMSHGQPP